MVINVQTQLHSGIRPIAADDMPLALTFDDGPDLQYTPPILDILKRYGVPATFFCIGSQIQRHPDVLRRMVQSGHTVANHSWSHPHLTRETAGAVGMELDWTSIIIAETVGLRPRFFRPPYGDFNDAVAHQAQDRGYEIVLWDVDSVDWSGIPGPHIAANVLARLKSGAILLHHSAGNVAGTVDALPYLFEVAQAMGYQFVRLDEIMGTPAYHDDL